MPDRPHGENTRAVHLPPPPRFEQVPVGLPVWRTSAFAFRSSQEFADVLSGREAGYSYARVDSPTADAFAEAVAVLEGVGLDQEATGQPFASGMAAIAATLMAFTGQGEHVVASRTVYGQTFSLLDRVLRRFGVDADFVDVTDLDAVRAAMRPKTRLVWAETIANPTTTVADLPSLAAIAHEAGALLAVDSTFASPAVCRPLPLGADLVVHSATKYMGGHNDATGGVVVGRPSLLSEVRAMRIETGGVLAPDEAFLLRRGLETLPLRVRRQCATAHVFAATIEKHPSVDRVEYPGLESHPGHALARKLFDAGPEGTRFGGIVTVTPRGGREAGVAFADSLRLAMVASSLGGTHTKVSPVATTTHRQLDDAALAAAGIAPGAVRLSIGLEDPDDLVADAVQALDTISW
ncbi:MAG: trans-sulfuration enzyme family protein [Streptosporangiaceae bacterium]